MRFVILPACAATIAAAMYYRELWQSRSTIFAFTKNQLHRGWQLIVAKSHERSSDGVIRRIDGRQS